MVCASCSAAMAPDRIIGERRQVPGPGSRDRGRLRQLARRGHGDRWGAGAGPMQMRSGQALARCGQLGFARRVLRVTKWAHFLAMHASSRAARAGVLAGGCWRWARRGTTGAGGVAIVFTPINESTHFCTVYWPTSLLPPFSSRAPPGWLTTQEGSLVARAMILLDGVWDPCGRPDPIP